MNERQAFYQWLVNSDCPVKWTIASDNKGFTIVTFNYNEEDRDDSSNSIEKLGTLSTPCVG